MSNEAPEDVGRLTYGRILVLSAVIFLILPFITTFNELLTKIVMQIQFYVYLQNLIVPVLVRMVGATLQYVFGIQTTVSNTSLYLPGKGFSGEIYMSWNCIGWQSLILFLFTLLTGLQGPYTLKSKILCLIIGLQGTFLVNLSRIVSVILFALYWGQLPSLIFHDYGGTLLTLLWLALFWYLSQEHILKRVTGEHATGNLETLQDEQAQ